MYVAILCGGKGMRLNGGALTPKPLAEVHDTPLVEHVMSIYGDQQFLLLLGHGGDAVRLHFLLHPFNDRMELLDTGREALTCGRLLQVKSKLNCAPFAVAYADCLADVNIQALLAFHKAHKKLATVVAAQLRLPYSALSLEGYEVRKFKEKPRLNIWSSVGFFLFEQGAFEYFDAGALEETPLQKLAEAGQLCAYKHEGFCICVDNPKVLAEANALTSEPWLRHRVSRACTYNRMTQSTERNS